MAGISIIFLVGEEIKESKGLLKQADIEMSLRAAITESLFANNVLMGLRLELNMNIMISCSIL